MAETVTVFFREGGNDPRTHKNVVDVRVVEGVLRVLMEDSAYLYPLDTIRLSHTQLDSTD
jgi:hypothetical protein